MHGERVLLNRETFRESGDGKDTERDGSPATTRRESETRACHPRGFSFLVTQFLPFQTTRWGRGAMQPIIQEIVSITSNQSRPKNIET